MAMVHMTAETLSSMRRFSIQSRIGFMTSSNARLTNRFRRLMSVDNAAIDKGMDFWYSE